MRRTNTGIRVEVSNAQQRERLICATHWEATWEGGKSSARAPPRMQWWPSTTEMLVAADAKSYCGVKGIAAVFLGLSLCHAVPFEPCAVGLNCFTLVTVCFNRDFSKPLMPPNNACLLLSILGRCRKRSPPAQCKWQEQYRQAAQSRISVQTAHTLLLFAMLKLTDDARSRKAFCPNLHNGLEIDEHYK